MQKNIITIWLIAVVLVFVSAASNAASNEQLYELQKSEVEGTEVFLNGMGAVKKLNATYYVAALYLQEKSNIDSDIIFMEGNKRITIKFMLDRVSARGFGREMAGALKINNVPEEVAAYRSDLRKFIGLFKGIYQKGDTLTFDYTPKRGVTVRHNGESLGNISKKGFDKVLFKAWLGDKPFSASFKRGLIGGNEDREAIDLLRQYVDVN
ncbi:MAG: chalcone isomerase family protein [Gammaproteobacteria bacterium]|nr:chalcone isomerase family protein [Gammaproteobacteria bacterium]